MAAPVRSPAIEASHLAHNIPARLTLGQTQPVEIQIKRSPLNPGGPNARPSPDRRDVVTARAISVRLRPVKGRFVIDQTSPETQWDKAIDGARLGGEIAVWRLTVQPQALGTGELLLTVAARTVTADGMIIESALPDQTFEVRTRRDMRRTLGWIGTLALVAVASVAVLEFTELLLGFNPLRALKDFVWR
jgi:hypothetical protein